MFDPKRIEDLNYIRGFDDGCDYIVAEIERYAEQYKTDPLMVMPLRRLLDVLKVPAQEGQS